LTHIIAEAGINHNGNLETAKRLVAAAKAAGADSVKFQKRNPEVCVPSAMKESPRDTPWGSMTYLEYKHRLEFGMDEFVELDSYARELGIPWSASAWDFDSLSFLDHFELRYHKVASALNTHLSFVEEVARRGLPTLMSTGMIDLPTLDKSVEVFLRHNEKLTLLHCVSTYPAAESELNLRKMETLQARYGLPVGYSGHEPSVSPSVIAAVLGATVIERHFTLDRSSWGTDHAASLEPSGFANMVSMIRKIPLVLGDGQEHEIPGESAVAAKLRYWEAEPA
jgi:N-acetylneuraminate synthase